MYAQLIIMEKIPKFKVGDKINSYIISRIVIPEMGQICYIVKCKCAKSFKITQSSLAKSKMCRTCVAQGNAAKPRPQPGEVYGTFVINKLAYDGKTNDERRYDCKCSKCGINTYISERKLQQLWPCGFCKY